MRAARLVILCWLALCSSAWAQCSVSNLTACPSPLLNIVTANTFNGTFNGTLSGTFSGNNFTGSAPNFTNVLTAPGINLATGTLNWTDATTPRNFNAHNVWTGTSTLGTQLTLNRILTVDSISYPVNTQFITSLDITQQFGGPTSTGTHIALNVLSQQTASTGTFAAGGAFNMVGAAFSGIASFNEGGTSFVPGGHSGSVFGWNPAAILKSGATFFSELTGGEINIAAQTGSSVFVKYGIAMTKEAADAVQGAAGLDAGITFSDQLGAVPWFYGIQFGNEGGQWAFDSNAVLIGSRLNSSSATPIGTAKWDLDFLSNTTTNGLIQGPNFHVGSTGIVRVGFGTLKPDPAGMVITADTKQAATATIAAAGTGYQTGYAYDVAGNIWHIDSVNGSGGITAVTIFQAVQTGTATTPINMAPEPYNLGATGASLTVSYASGTDIIMSGLPTSAPSTHCALWSNSNVITRTTCP